MNSRREPITSVTSNSSLTATKRSSQLFMNTMSIVDWPLELKDWPLVIRGLIVTHGDLETTEKFKLIVSPGLKLVSTPAYRNCCLQEYVLIKTGLVREFKRVFFYGSI